jgi:hypothetical protein
MRLIGKGPETDALYAAEDTACTAIDEAARALEAVLRAAGVLPEVVDHWHDVRPEAILNVLESQASGAVLVACLAYLDWYRAYKPTVFGAALGDWTDQRTETCPICEAPLNYTSSTCSP